MNPKLQKEIQDEQDHGRQKYGGGNAAHDLSRTWEDWCRYAKDHLDRSCLSPPMDARQHMVKVAGLAASAIEAFDEKKKRGTT